MLSINRIFDKRISSSIDKACCAVEEILCCLQSKYGPVDEDTLFELRVILNEMILNAVRHGNGQDESKQVRIAAGVTSSRYIVLIIKDEGNGYDYERLCRKNAAADNNKFCNIQENGRGIMIVNNLCDMVKVNAKGNRILALKRL